MCGQQRHLPDELFSAGYEQREAYEVDIAENANVDPDDVILDVPEEPEIKESTSRVLVNGEVRPLEDQSTLVSALRTAQRDQWRLGVYAPDDRSERVGNAAVRTLGLDIEDARIRDVRPGRHVTLDEFN